MSFVAIGNPVSENPISNNGFWPDLDPINCRSVMRLDQSVTPERLRHALTNAIIGVNLELLHWQAEQEELGYDSLDQVPATLIDGASALAHHYRRAIYCFTKAELTERYRDYDTTLSGHQRADEMDPSIGDYRRQGRLAIRAILKRTATTIELI